MSSDSDFDRLLLSADLPSPGPAYYEARRKLWLTPRPERAAPPPNPERRRKLEMLISPLEGTASDQCWDNIQRLWKVICSGRRFTERISLQSMITIVHATWIQEETWPKGALVQTSDETPAI